jgi:hypothetical protein
MALTSRLLAVTEGIPVWQFVVRLLWLAVQLILVICIGERGVLFFYQGF